MQLYRRLCLWLMTLVLLASHPAPHAFGHPADGPLVYLKTIETGGRPSAIVFDRAANRNDVVFYDGDRVRFIDGDTLALSTDALVLPTTAWEGWMVADPTHPHVYVVTLQHRSTPMRVYWIEVQVHVVADRTVLNSFSVNDNYNTDPLAPADRFYGLDGLALKAPLSEGMNPARLILDDTANGNIDVVDLSSDGTDAVSRQRYSYRPSLCGETSCSWTDNAGNTLALETNHETAVPDDLAAVDVLYIGDLNTKEDGFPVQGHVRALQIGHPGQALNAMALPDVDMTGTWPFSNGFEGLAMATGRDVVYVASGQQSFNAGYVGAVKTVSEETTAIEVTYGDEGFVTVDPQDPKRVFVGTFDGWYNDPNQALYLTMLYDDVVVDTLKLVDTYDETNGLRAMAYDPTHRRLYLAVGSTMMVVEVNHGETCPAPLTGVEIAGTALGQIDTPYTFLAVTTPANATSPVSYTWSPEPLSGQGTAVVTYSWASPGDYAVALTASNCGGVDTATHNVKILAAAPERVCLPVIVR